MVAEGWLTIELFPKKQRRLTQVLSHVLVRHAVAVNRWWSQSTDWWSEDDSRLDSSRSSCALLSVSTDSPLTNPTVSGSQSANALSLCIAIALDSNVSLRYGIALHCIRVLYQRICDHCYHCYHCYAFLVLTGLHSRLPSTPLESTLLTVLALIPMAQPVLPFPLHTPGSYSWHQLMAPLNADCRYSLIY